MKNNRRMRREPHHSPRGTVVRTSGRRLREILGILLVTVTILIILSLLSHHAADPSFSSTGETATSNWVGPFGAYLSDAVILAFGWVSWLTPLLTFALALTIFFPSTEHPWRRRARIAGAVLVTLDLAALPSALGFSGDPFFGSVTPGGVVGQVTASLLTSLFSRPGSLVILAALLAVGVILTTGLSLEQIGAGTLRGWRWLTARLGRAAGQLTAEQPEPAVLPPRLPKTRKPKAAAAGEENEAEPGPEIRIPVAPPPVRQTQFNFHADGNFELPPLSLRAACPSTARAISRETLLMNSRILEKKLRDFGIEGQVTHVHPGPVITMYEYAPAPGIKVNRIANLQDDLAMAMSAISVRVVAPIPGKAVVGIEIPNPEMETVYMLDVLTSDEFKKASSKLAFALGKDIFGHPVASDLTRMPHLLIAGATGTGKSVMLNTLICSILFRATPAEVRFLMIDPKMVELTPYEGIPHLITPVVTNPKKASWALKNVVRIMEERYRILAEKDAKNIESFNAVLKASKNREAGEEPMTYLVVVIDELADLMMLASSDVEDSVTRLAQMARAVGIHLVLATQRPSVNVITGVIKANLPARLSFQVSSKNDSRIILDANGAEQLLGRGDMLFLPPGASKLRRVHGAYIAESEIRSVVEFLKDQAEPTYDEALLQPIPDDDEEDGETGNGSGEADEKYDEAVELVRRTGQASISMIQRRLRVGYNRAARMVEMMEREGIITPPDGVKARRIMPPGSSPSQ